MMSNNLALFYKTLKLISIGKKDKQDILAIIEKLEDHEIPIAQKQLNKFLTIKK